MKLYNNKFQKSLPMLLLALVMIPTVFYGQEKKISIGVGAGTNLTSFDFDFKNHKVKEQNGYNFGLEFDYKFHKKWSVGVGVSYLKLDSKLQINKLDDSFRAVDYEKDVFDFRYSASNISEKYKTEFIQIPIFVRYEGVSKTTFYAQAGIKFAFAIKGTYEQQIESFKTSAYYPEYNIELSNPLFMGFGDFGGISSSGNLNLKTSYTSNIEAGLKQQFSNGKPLYIGLFFDYGLTNMLSKADDALVDYKTNSPTDFSFKSITNSKFGGTMKMSSFGIKAKYNFW